jgi:transcriptional regulator with XRE-family HTH domain
MTHPTDALVGRRIRQARLMRGQTQEQVAAKIGVKFQQLQKYETAMNRVSASRLKMIAGALDMPRRRPRRPSSWLIRSRWRPCTR